MHRVFHTWWTSAGAEYVPFHDGRPNDILTLYYDPLINYHHRVGLGGGLSLAFQLTPQARNEAQRLFEAAAEKMGWTGSAPVREVTRDFTSQAPTPQGTLLGLALAREFGNDAVYTKLKDYAEAHYAPTWNPDTGEFTWGFGLNEPHPRGQFNAAMMTAEAESEGAWWRVFNEPNLHKFAEPTVHSVDFPNVCLSRAWYDSERHCLLVSTDAGVPGAKGQSTSFRVSRLDPHHCTVTVDGQLSDSWRVVGDELEIMTTVGQHTFLITQRGNV
jgi:hypothetical protein